MFLVKGRSLLVILKLILQDCGIGKVEILLLDDVESLISSGKRRIG